MVNKQNEEWAPVLSFLMFPTWSRIGRCRRGSWQVPDDLQTGLALLNFDRESPTELGTDGHPQEVTSRSG